MAAVNPIPDGHPTVSPYLVVRGVAGLIDFCRQAFGAQEMERMATPDGTVTHAEIRIGDSVIMMGDPGPDGDPMPAMLHLYLPDADATYRRAIDAGATSVREPTTEFYGDRIGGVKDRWGNQWWMSTHVEDVPPEELARRAAARQR